MERKGEHYFTQKSEALATGVQTMLRDIDMNPSMDILIAALTNMFMTEYFGLVQYERYIPTSDEIVMMFEDMQSRGIVDKRDIVTNDDGVFFHYNVDMAVKLVVFWLETSVGEDEANEFKRLADLCSAVGFISDIPTTLQ